MAAADCGGGGRDDDDRSPGGGPEEGGGSIGVGIVGVHGAAEWQGNETV